MWRHLPVDIASIHENGWVTFSQKSLLVSRSREIGSVEVGTVEDPPIVLSPEKHADQVLSTGEEMNEWQPTDTAPRNGTEVLLFARGHHNED